MSLLDGDLTARLAPEPSRATRKGAKFYRLGKPITACPYTNARRRQQFEWAWQESENFEEWDAVLSDGLE